MAKGHRIALIHGDGIGYDVSEAAVAVIDAALDSIGISSLNYEEIKAGAGYYQETGKDIEPGGEERAGAADIYSCVFDRSGAVGGPNVRVNDDGPGGAPFSLWAFSGRRETSFAAVEVTPQIEDDIDIEVLEDMDFYDWLALMRDDGDSA